ncbi:multidrug dmt transporter permease : EamA-like transporter family protein OS=Ralstonia pickettii GN=DP23_1404 PE=4 SV=1: EamA: EamA [Gemmata massiliana]|uniref:EamA domain-containing protein n=1 Tax=Gemmata massiliana TaxID=1210884 RepID=A0A6P2D1G5_9BACT|nr:DMT family transporter [Gemmata massiliana]VTR95111.1 multidrug dmt transporter permease : EamA-like transporter family protein OS=Ralstonia pickettii GN=DP23_1404 PE=4 SV=1: EamA: EamA [Gemmata massiliana]
MSPWVAGLVLFSAVLHASWNALLKSGGDRLRGITVMAVSAGIISAVWVCFLPAPHVESWFYIFLPVVLHVAYYFLLVWAYRHGDLGVSYPVARGSSPLLVAAGAALVAGERLDTFTLLGIVLVCGGIFGLARGRSGTRGMVPALLTGAIIATYSVADGLGSRAAGNAWSYAAWLFVFNGLAMLPVLFWRGARFDSNAQRSAAGGVVSLVGYAIVIWAASISPMGQVSALRESSVVVAAILGWLFLGEQLGSRRLAACLIVAAGAACLGLRG